MKLAFLLLLCLLLVSQVFSIEYTDIMMKKAEKETFTLTRDSIKPDHPEEVTEQLRLDKIRSALLNLPSEELSRLGVDLTNPVLEGTPEAESLFSAWESRQAEIKRAMEALLEPAQYMKKILEGLAKPTVTSESKLPDIEAEKVSLPEQQASGHYMDNLSDQESFSLAQKEELLSSLEYLLSDLDNARDFKTIGGWPILARLLHNSASHHSLRSLATWAVGSAVKSSYDAQLWLLEPFSVRYRISETAEQEDETTGLEVLLENFSAEIGAWTKDLEASASSSSASLSTSIETHEQRAKYVKHLLYAFSSALSGNLEIQYGMHEYDQRASSELFVKPLLAFLRAAQVSSPTSESSKRGLLDVQRKVWTILADTLSGTVFANQELSQMRASTFDELSALHGRINETSGPSEELNRRLELVGEQYLSVVETQEKNLFFQQFLSEDFFSLAVKELQASVQVLAPVFLKEDSNVTLSRSELNNRRSILKSLVLFFQSSFILAAEGSEGSEGLLLQREKLLPPGLFSFLVQEVDLDEDEPLRFFLQHTANLEK